MRDCILFFVKYPTPGEVKTRLAEDSSPEMAAEFYAVFVREKLAELADGCKADIIVCFTPEEAKPDMPGWLGNDLRYIAQKGADLGRRMENGFREAFFMGYDRVVLTGSDIPGLSPAIIREGLDALGPNTVSLGPADDGGYYLIGFHRAGFVPEIFRDMAWSTDDVFQRTLNGLEEEGKECTELPCLEDMDTIDDVGTLAALGAVGPLKGEALTLAREIAGL